MRQFLIDENSLNVILKVLGRVPAKKSLNAISIIHALKPYIPNQTPVAQENAPTE